MTRTLITKNAKLTKTAKRLPRVCFADFEVFAILRDGVVTLLVHDSAPQRLKLAA